MSASLPAKFPDGTHFVIEGRPDQSGKMRIVSRVLLLPDGTAFNLNERQPRVRAAAAHRRDDRRRSAPAR